MHSTDFGVTVYFVRHRPGLYLHIQNWVADFIERQKCVSDHIQVYAIRLMCLYIQPYVHTVTNRRQEYINAVRRLDCPRVYLSDCQTVPVYLCICISVCLYLCVLYMCFLSTSCELPSFVPVSLRGAYALCTDD